MAKADYRVIITFAGQDYSIYFTTGNMTVSKCKCNEDAMDIELGEVVEITNQDTYEEITDFMSPIAQELIGRLKRLPQFNKSLCAECEQALKIPFELVE